MTLGPIGVRIGDGTVDRHVTRHVSDLTFRKEVPGGHLSASFTLDVSLDDFPALGQNDRVTIYSTITGKPLWDGDSGVITRQLGNEGERYQIIATGGSGRLTDQTLKLVYIDRTTEHWQQDTLLTQVAGGECVLGDAYPSGARAAGGTEANADGSGRACVRVGVPSGTPVVSGSKVSARYAGFVDSVMCPGAWGGYTPDAVVGATKLYGDLISSGVCFDLTGALSVVTGTDYYRATAHNAGGTPPTGRWPINTRTLAVAWVSTAATTIAVDDAWVATDPPVVLAQLLTKTGALVDMGSYAPFVSTPILSAYVLASDVVADLVGRSLDFLDRAGAAIAATTYQIQQCAFADGISAADLFAWMTTYEPDYFHEVLARDDDTGLFAFAWRQWDDTNPRYVVYRSDDYDAPGGESPLCNELHIFWTDPGGVKRETVVTVAVPDLDTPAFGPARRRQADPITLPDGVASEADAARIGLSLLTQANRGTGTGTGTAVIRRWVWDLWTQAWVHCCELLPGYSVQVAETGEVFRCTAVDYSDADGAMTLTLGHPVRTPDQLVADLFRRGRSSDWSTR